MQPARVIISERVARFVLAAHRVFPAVKNTEPKQRGLVRPVNRGVAVERIHDASHGGPCVSAGVGGKFLHVREGGRHGEARRGRRVVNQPIAVSHPVDHRRGLEGDRIEIAEAHVEIQLRARGVGGDRPRAKRVAVRIAEAELVNHHAQHEALDVDDARLFRGAIFPRGIVITAKPVLRVVQRAHARVVVILEKIIHDRERFLHRLASLQPEILHEARIKRVRQHRGVPPEKRLEILRPAKVVGVVEVNAAAGYLGHIHRADHHKSPSAWRPQ